jgi:hypothetical protein
VKVRRGISKKETGTATEPPPVEGIDAFSIDTFLFSFLNYYKKTPLFFGIFYSSFLLLCLILSVILSDLQIDDLTATSVFSQMQSILFYKWDALITKVPLIIDAPGILILLVSTATPCRVYYLLHDAQSLHRDLAKHGGVAFGSEGFTRFNTYVREMNSTLKKLARYRDLALIYSFCVASIVFFLQKNRVYEYLGGYEIYSNWWASLDPFRVGGLVIIFFFGLAIYAILVEIAFTWNYTRFLKKCKNDCFFCPNAANPDGFFGWLRLRRIINNLKSGLYFMVCGVLALTYYLIPAGRSIGILLLLIFIIIVVYTFTTITSFFKEQALKSKNSIVERIEQRIQKFENRGALQPKALLIEYEKLKLIQKIPSPPIAPPRVLVGLATAAPAITLILQFVS